MSADNYFIIRKHPKGGYAVVMGFSSNPQVPRATQKHYSFNTVSEALDAATEYSEYGVHVHSECADAVRPVDRMVADIATLRGLTEDQVRTYYGL